MITNAAPHADAHGRARFDAVRRRVFFEMRNVGSRWRLLFVVPFHALVLGILVFRGFPTERLFLQIAATATLFVGFYALDKAYGAKHRALLMLCGASLFVLIANTGGLASPLIVGIVPFFIGVAMNPELENQRRHFVVKFVVLFGVMAWFAKSYAIPVPLATTTPFASSEYVLIAFVSACMSFLAVYAMGKGMTAAYERITLDLAMSREELCDENEGRTRALEGIAARLAHEVKNPLAAIKGLSTHMARSTEDAKVKERLTIVAAEAERLQEIVDGFLSFSRGLDDLTIAPAKPYELARDLALLLETRAAEAGVAVEVRGSRTMSLEVDAKKLRQALLNLVINAMQASPREATVTLEVAKSCSDGATVVRIIDRGAGMSREVIDRIRKPYFTTKEGGSGLGIAIARGIIEQHGGSLHFESTVGRGTVATVTLPASACRLREKLPNPCHWATAAAAKAKAGVSSAPPDGETALAPLAASSEEVPS